MNLTYEWQPEEWREALLLASARPRRSSKPVMTYGVVAMMALGAMGELVNAVRSSVQADYSGSLVPMLLFAAAVVAAMQLYARAVNRRKSLGTPASMPAGQQQLVLAEGGWRATPADGGGEAEVRPWKDLQEQRTGRRSMILLGQGNTFAALPLRVLSASQGGHLHRLLIRKLHRIA